MLIFINDFKTKHFKTAFINYFTELNISVNNWDNLFEEMNNEGNNYAYVLEENNEIIGFIQFKEINAVSYFFEEKQGFIREFWIKKEFRNCGYGTKLLKSAEDFFKNNNIYKIILTTDTAEDFYIKLGYVKDSNIKAKNDMQAFVKQLRQ